MSSYLPNQAEKWKGRVLIDMVIPCPGCGGRGWVWSPVSIAKKKVNCVGCAGTGERERRLPVPNPGDKVKILDRDLLVNIKGEDADEAELARNAVVHRVDEPDDHQYDWIGPAVQVSWDKLNPDGSIPKAAKESVTLWAFSMMEVQIV